MEGTGQQVIEQACHLRLEGIVSERRSAVYHPGRGLDWLKVKCLKREEFVIGGFTRPGGSRAHFGALLLGFHDHRKKPIYAGRVGTGFDRQTLTDLHRKLMKLARATLPFANLPGTAGQARDVTWVKPALVAAVEFSSWTDERLLRHPTFQGLREDEPARAVIHDEPLSLSEAGVVRIGHAATGSHQNGHADGVKQERWAGVRLTHPEKVLFPEHGLTKRDLADYYVQVADWMLPHVVDRPLAVVRCPSGSGKPCFFQKHLGEGSSEHLRPVNVSVEGEPEYHIAIDDLGGLMALVQMCVLEIHVWGARARQFERPDRLVFDLDPDPAVDWSDVVEAARAVRLLLEDLGLASFLKTTGGNGLHVVVPIQPRTEWEDAKAFCRAVADFIVRAAPDRFIATMSKAAREGKIFVDYLRNGRGATAVAPYSTRAKPGATVSVPIAWDELTARVRSDQFTIANVPDRLRALKNDPWAEMAKTKQSITAAMRKKLGVR
jgi:bifunctional non-homologous end joining protein LigD